MNITIGIAQQNDQATPANLDWVFKHPNILCQVS